LYNFVIADLKSYRWLVDRSGLDFRPKNPNGHLPAVLKKLCGAIFITFPLFTLHFSSEWSAFRFLTSIITTIITLHMKKNIYKIYTLYGHQKQPHRRPPLRPALLLLAFSTRNPPMPVTAIIGGAVRGALPAAAYRLSFPPAAGRRVGLSVRRVTVPPTLVVGARPLRYIG
jgi:hypothetical protein